MTTSIPTKTLHQVLEKIEEMKLPEGEYLALANMLKSKHTEEINSSTLEIPSKIQFIGKKTWTIETYTKHYYPGQRQNEVEYSVNGVRKRATVTSFARHMFQLYLMNITKTIRTEEMDIEFDEFVSHYLETTQAMGEEEGIEGTNVMIRLFGV